MMLSIGIVLFVAGFVMTVATFPVSESSGSDLGRTTYGGVGMSEQFLLASGVLVSLLGVVVATVLPTAMAIRANRKH